MHINRSGHCNYVRAIPVLRVLECTYLYVCNLVTARKSLTAYIVSLQKESTVEYK